MDILNQKEYNKNHNSTMFLSADLKSIVFSCISNMFEGK